MSRKKNPELNYRSAKRDLYEAYQVAVFEGKKYKFMFIGQSALIFVVGIAGFLKALGIL